MGGRQNAGRHSRTFAFYWLFGGGGGPTGHMRKSTFAQTIRNWMNELCVSLAACTAQKNNKKQKGKALLNSLLLAPIETSPRCRLCILSDFNGLSYI